MSNGCWATRGRPRRGQACAIRVSCVPKNCSPIEEWVRKQTGVSRLWQDVSPDAGSLDHNSAQLVGEADARPGAHTDSKDCRYAGVWT